MQSTSKINRVARGLNSRVLAALVSIIAHSYMPAQADEQSGLARWAKAPHRTAGNVARDGFRHPLETLAFFGIKENSTVVEILPGSGGYYMEILAPSLKARGRYIAANRDEAAAPQYLADHQKLLARLKAEPALYEKVLVTKFNADKHEIASAGSADFVLTFRNLHNWVERNEADGALRAFYRALKPGGVLGVVDHRGRTDMSQEAQMKSGYVRQDYAIALIEKAGFKLAGASEVNANRKDTKDHPEGVWTLPPSYRLKEKDRAKYQAIGESDRFTLKFVKQ
ncbi:MAG TPA: methyltransferase domain-containing protein [Candidatus Binatia bacterium]|nr:methyltransferase domain-containing protein [Candidatus Binatia bacterium]